MSGWSARGWGASGLSLVALGRTSARYDFRADPTAADTEWISVL